MKISWDTLITVIATFTAQFSSAYWLWKKTRATESPMQKPPRRLTGIIGRTKYLIRTYSLTAIALALPVFGVLWELSRPGPANDASLFFIFLFTVALCVEISTLAAFALYVRLSRRVAELSSDLSVRTVALAKALEGQGNRTIETFREVVVALDAIAPRKEPDALDRLRGAIKGLFDGLDASRSKPS